MVPEEVLLDEDNKYNWYFTYGFENLSVDNSGNVSATFTIRSTQEQNTIPDKELEHLGINCPMLGKALNLSGPIYPKVQMQHLATLHEVSIRNETTENTVSGAKPGDIQLYSFGVSAPTTGVWDKAGRLSLTGIFDLNLKTDVISNYGSSSDNISLTLPEDGVKIEKPNGDTFYDYKLYFVTAPIKELQTGATYVRYFMSAAGDVLTETDYNKLSDKSGYTEITEEVGVLYKNTTNANIVKTQQQYDNLDENSKTSYIAFATPEIYRQDIFSFIVNGSARTVQTGETYKNFSSGVVKRFILPVKSMQYPLASDAVGNGLTWSDELNDEPVQPVISFDNTKTITTTINGTVRNDVYQVGTNGASGVIYLRGFAQQLINALPAGFYASQLNNQPTAMSLKHIQIWMPTYDDKVLNGRPVMSDWKMTVPVKVSSWMTFPVDLGLDFIGEQIGLSFTDGITYSSLVGLGINPETISFNGMVANGANDKLLVMDEAPVYKELSITNIQSFLDRFSVDPYQATFAGIQAMVNATQKEDGTFDFGTYDGAAAIETANAIIAKLQQVVGDSEKVLFEYGRFKLSVSMAETISPYLFEDANDFIRQFRDMRFEVALQTVPYATGYSLKPMLLWGFDKNAPL